MRIAGACTLPEEGAPAVVRVPPFQNVALGELLARCKHDLTPRDLRIDQRHPFDILQLVAEAVGPAPLAGAGPPHRRDAST